MALYELDGIRPETPENENYWVAPDANVIGKVIIGDDVGIWFGVTIRGDNEAITLGKGTNVQEGTIMHTDPSFPIAIGEGCTIGHGAIIHGCTIGDYSLIGMGATVLNGAKIGKNCLVGANALVTEGKEFPDNSLIVGAPAKAVRTLDDGAVAGLKMSASHYVANWKRFKTGLKKVAD
ncbi:gamma carbonic anhydrase family protein [Rhizobium sp. L1K21]|uniref:gamma carbonic anhydrase family protein n=1 Tax=Rhizobium sp. L1K21 TaxID=2954933 RepID=UPI002093F744|nr:gamma carbonic anhydrase family protein [Rhizobium sp. L1K21]MCO6186173.1 gamma carbonic anhydrase family protein [Rhizobium sp. L1K21]